MAENTLRGGMEIRFDFSSGATESNDAPLHAGAFGTLVVPSGSPLVGKALQVVAVSDSGKYPDTDMLSAAKTLVAGNNPFTSDELLAFAAASRIKLRVDTAVSGAAYCYLLWKS